MNRYKNVVLSQNANIREALVIIDSGGMQIALIVDPDNKLIGTLTDGDIRRGLLKGLQLESPIDLIIARAPIVAKITDTKERVLQLALTHKIHKIPVVDEHGVLVGLQEIDQLVKPQVKPNEVVLMVGGLGTRLRPLTEDTPKPMLKVGSKPILQTIVEKFVEYGYVNITMCVNYKSEIIQNYFGTGEKFGAHIKYVLEEQRMGTAGALSLLKNKPTDAFFVMNGDLLTNVNFEHFQDFHSFSNAVATMGVRSYDFQVPYGVVNIEEDHVLSIEEKPVHKFYVSAGIYMLSPDILDLIPNNEFYDMPTLFNNIIQLKLKASSFPIHEYWMDIGQMEEYEKANNEYHEVF